MNNNTYTSFLNPLKFIGARLIAIFHLGCMYYRLGYNDNFLFIPDDILLSFQFISELFFIISGYLAIASYNRHQTLNLRTKIKRYYKDAFFTITLIFIIKILFCNTDDSGLGYTNIYSYLVQLFVLGPQIIMLNTKEGLNSPLWYIAVLMICYVIVKYSKNNRKIYSPLILAGILIFTFHFRLPLINGWTGRGLASFFTGCELYYYLKEKREFSKTENITLILLIIFLFIFILTYNGKMLYPAILLFFVLLISFLSKCKIIEMLTNNKICRFLGKSSYYIYVYGALCYQTLYIIMYRSNINSHIHAYFICALIFNILLGILITFVIDKRKEAKNNV